MNNVKKNRTSVRMLGNGDKWTRFTMNKTQRDQPVYSNVQPRCSESKTDTGCKTCHGCTYTIDVSKNAFNGAYPTNGSFVSVNLIVDSSANEPYQWQYNATVESFSLTVDPVKGAKVTLNIENEKCIGSIIGVYFYAPVSGNGIYMGQYKRCDGTDESSQYAIDVTQNGPYPTNAKRMGAPYRNPIAGWRNSLDCCENGLATTGESRQPTNTIYKDNYSGEKGPDGSCPTDCLSNKVVQRPGIQGRTHRPIIRSGMQEKNNCCKSSNGGCQKKNNYSFSYQQYLNNSRCLSYERSLEKYVIPSSENCGSGKNSYRKSSCCNCSCNNDTEGRKCGKKDATHTVYNPSNKKFSKQGAVSAGSRLDRLKLDTIKASNSKCVKRYKEIKSKFVNGTTYKVPNGNYGGGKPRFTGWMFNGHHSEVKGRVYNMVRYNQQPLGIPQLTATPLSCVKQCFPRTLNSSSNGSTAAGNRSRIPGSKCHDKSQCSKCGDNSINPCKNIPNQTGQGLSCC
uniref:Uncharacterized protein n=1 Tax=viral metagenome TaxID=1070528 RepID=A0A6C0C404_9ZZZZ